MESFLQETVKKLLQSKYNLSDCTIILPSKRAGGFLKRILSEHSEKSFFAPKIISIEEFIEEISGLQIMAPTALLIESYKVYVQQHDETFEEYLSWANTLLNDFSEIDRYLVPEQSFFDYLSSIKVLEKWGVKDQPSDLVKNYLKFWGSLYNFYSELNEVLSSKQYGYQGMVYRKAAEDIEHYIAHTGSTPHLFIGFNALNTAEQTIIQELLENGLAEVFWDMDPYFVADPQHSVSLFFRRYMKDWKYYQQNGLPTLSSKYSEAKDFTYINTQSDLEQVKYVGNLLKSFSEETLQKTAIVLAEENLLIPLLYSLPKNVNRVNVTMGYPIQKASLVTLIQDLIQFQLKPTGTLYYKTVQKILNNASLQFLVPESAALLQYISENNKTYISFEELLEIPSGANPKVIAYCFKSWEGNTAEALHAIRSLLNLVQQSKALHPFEKQIALKVAALFNEIDKIMLENGFQKMSTLKSLLEELIATETLDFEGDAYQGLQIMGVLETRVLDFEHLIMLSVNEGTLPSGKSNASYITYDLKKQFQLPMHTEKDAVYAFHFFRLLQRTQKAYFSFNTASNGLNSGEMSRFLLQLEIQKHPNHQLEHISLSQNISMEEKPLKTVPKNEALLKRLQEIAKKGFSPSALTSYIRNPIDFYYDRVLRIKELEEVEETVAYNTLGTIVHETLEEIYHPFLKRALSKDLLKEGLKKIPEVVDLKFKEYYKLGDYTKGKNLIIFEVAKKYVEHLILWDLKALETGNRIEIIALEKSLEVPFSQTSLSFPVVLKGTVDRIDRYNGQLRIIDYKTGSVKQNELDLVDWDPLLEDYKYAKAFQVMLYAYMLYKENGTLGMEAGIISFKNLKNGFMNFGIKESARARKKEAVITEEILKTFEVKLVQIIEEICNPSKAFIEKIL